MATWEDLNAELEAWHATGQCAGFWWRDDDAITQTPGFERLRAVANQSDAPIAMAVIPAEADETLLRDNRWPVGAAFLQHGYIHANHAPKGQKKAEFGDHRSLGTMIADIEAGWRKLRPSDIAYAVFVPPWNRIADNVVDALADVGFRGLSTYGPRTSASPALGLTQVNAHIDPIDWRGTRGFVGESNALSQVVDHLVARRLNAVDRAEPSGLLTHHLVHDDEIWRFVDELTTVISNHPGSRWISVEEMFAQ